VSQHRRQLNKKKLKYIPQRRSLFTSGPVFTHILSRRCIAAADDFIALSWRAVINAAYALEINTEPLATERAMIKIFI
jgi:hypothetical protein